jgi:hypothetical protein
LPDVTNQPTAPLTVQTASNVSTVRVEVASDDGGASLPAVAADPLDEGAFATEVPLLRNQWNRVRVVALVGAVEVGATELAVEHDDVPPAVPAKPWFSSAHPSPWVSGAGELLFTKVEVGFAAPEPGTRIELYEWSEALLYIPFPWSPAVTISISSPLGQFLGEPDPVAGSFALPRGRCYGHVLARSIDRAGNVSDAWRLVGSPTWLGGKGWCIV